jgi:integrase
LDHGTQGVIELRRGGSGAKTKSRRLRRIHIHPKLREVIDQVPRAGQDDRVFEAPPSTQYPEGGGPLKERRLLNTLKRLCRKCRFRNPDKYCLHTFRHAFASMCARSNLSQKYALSWMGQKSSEVFDMYYEMYDPTAEEAIATLDYEKVPDKNDRDKQSKKSGSEEKDRRPARRRSRPKSQAGEPTKRWKVTSRKRSAGDSG